MAILTEHPNTKLTIDLSGPEGNAFCLIGAAKRFAKRMDLDGAAIVTEMTTSDYENLIQVFDKYFGECVDLIR